MRKLTEAVNISQAGRGDGGLSVCFFLLFPLKSSREDLCFSFSLSLSRSLFRFFAGEMQRQSLGSPASKVHVHGVKEEDMDRDEKIRELEERDGDKKAEKVHRLSRPAQDSVIHLIPFIVLACFLILVLVSHSPSDEEMLKHGGLKRFPGPKVDSDFERLLEIKKGNVLGVVSHRSLQEVISRRVRKSPPLYLPRRLGNF